MPDSSDMKDEKPRGGRLGRAWRMENISNRRTRALARLGVVALALVAFAGHVTVQVVALVQPELLADRVDLLGAGVQAAQNFRRVAAEGLEEEEHQQHHAEQRGHHLPEASNQVGRHGRGVSGRIEACALPMQV